MEKKVKIEDIAKIAHQANKAYCESIGDSSQSDWENAPNWQKESVVKGVKFHLINPQAKPSASHEEWLKEKESTGWKYGPTKDADRKEHPCFVPYDELPKKQQAKDHLFKAIVNGLSSFIA